MSTFKHFKRATIQWLVQGYQRHTVRQATIQAYRTFARQHPQWVAELFDEHFVLTHLLPLLQKVISTGEKVTPVQVAELWARQIAVLPSLRQKHTVKMTPAATAFLYMVADELAENHVGVNAAFLVETAAR